MNIVTSIFFPGETAYVLSENPQAGGVGYWIWNPCTGSHYGQYEPHCPLISVGCIIDNTNVSFHLYCTIYIITIFLGMGKYSRV